MALIIADRVKETTTTQGTGTIALSGATFGGFQSFSDAIGEGNTTYYCIQNESNFEIGLGTFSSGTLSRDTVIKSSNSDGKISITGVALVFSVVPSSKLIYKDANGDFVLTGDVNIDDLNSDLVSANSGDFGYILSNGILSSGLLTLTRSSGGNFFHAYVDDSNDKTISLHSDGSATPTWKLGLKDSPSSETFAPNYGYVYGSDGQVGLVANSDNQITLANSAPFTVRHQGVNVITAHFSTGIHLNSMSSAYPALIVNGGISLSANIQEWDTYNGTTLSVVDSAGNFGIRNDNPSYQLDVTGTGSFSQAIRFGDGTIQTTSALPFASGQLIDQNSQNIITQSGYFQSYVSQSSGVLQSQIDQNTSNVSATSGYFESRVDSSDAAINTVSGLLTPSGQSLNFAGNVLTYNNSDGGSFTADLSSLSTFDTSGVSLGYSAGTLTYTNNAGGTFGVDLSSISGDVYAMIVDGAPSTLDTLNEIAAALNDDENIATTLTSLISTTSGNLQSQITSNDTDIATNVASINTVSGLLYDDSSVSGYFESRADSNQTNIATNTASINTVSGLIPNNTFNITAGDGSNYTIDGMGLNSASDPTMYMHKGHTYILNKTFSGHPFAVSTTDGGSVYSDADGNNIEIGSAADSVTFEVPQNAPDKLYYYCTAHPSNMKGLIYTTTDGAISGYFESRVDDNQSNISTNTSNIATKLPAASGAVITAVSGYFESRVDSADSNISTNSSNITANSGYFESRVDSADSSITANSGYFESRVDSADSSITANSGYFESRVDTNVADIITVSGLTSGGSQNLFSTISVAGQSDVVADATTDTLTLVAGSNMTITTNATSDTITFTSSGGGGTTHTAGSGLTLTGDEFNVYGGSGHFINLAVDGAFSATTKSFLIDHPTKDGMKLQYGSLEGPENGVYIRGTSGSNIITLPEYWSTLVDQSTVTVTLTSIGYYQPLYIKEKGKNYIKVGGCKGSYDYVVYGERKDVEKLKVEW